MEWSTGELRYPQLVLVVLLACLLGGLAWGFATSGVAYGPYNYDWDGGSELRSTLTATDTETTIALSLSDYEGAPPDETAAIVLDPGDRYDGAERAQLSSFVSQGGTLVVASAANGSTELVADLGSTIRIDGTPVRDEQHNLRDPAFPRANDVASHETVRNVSALTLNHGTVLEPGSATAIVNTSTLAYLDHNHNEELDADEELASRPVVAIEQLGDGAVIVVSDASVFTNAMLDEGGNSQFVRNLGEDHDYVLLDYSQQGSLPPLTYAFLLVRGSVPIQVGLSLLGIATIALWGRTGIRGRFERLWSSARGDDGEDSVAGQFVDAETLSTYLARRHPEWDDERIARVTEGILRTRRQGESNE